MITFTESGGAPVAGESHLARGTKVPSLVSFFILTNVVAWSFWLAAAALASRTDARSYALLFLPGTFAPGLVALWLTGQAQGRAGIRRLLDGVTRADVPVRWYVFAVGYLAAAKLAAALAHRLVGGEWPAFGDVPLYVMLVAVLFSTPFQAGEEIGWRGYALPRLASHLGLGRASLLLGVIWAAWHLPLFLIPGTTTTGQSFLLYITGVTALSVAMAWLYAHTRGSLLLVMIMHAAVNNTKDIVPSAVPGASDPWGASASLIGWLTAALLWVGAAYFLWRMPSLDRRPSIGS